mmetsp:Transcript_7783/g.16901  ORF Transcript_7783/g.16901 Transcript_7783/m.16901 type:complete len:311 (-) Transcript_7783:53-985(-)
MSSYLSSLAEIPWLRSNPDLIPVISSVVAVLIVILYRVLQYQKNKDTTTGRVKHKIVQNASTSFPSFDDYLSDESDEYMSPPLFKSKTILTKNKNDTRKKLQHLPPPPSVSDSSPMPRSFRSGKTNSSSKPFESSYYYAHNSIRKTGGYTDGIKTEDYVMNGPRLLSSTVEGMKTPDTGGNELNTIPVVVAESCNKVERSELDLLRAELRGTALNKYLIDESKDKDLIATVYISDIPGYDSWENSDIKKSGISTNFCLTSTKTSCVTIQMHNAKGENFYLLMKKVNGVVRDIKVIVKKKRLVVKLMKREA